MKCGLFSTWNEKQKTGLQVQSLTYGQSLSRIFYVTHLVTFFDDDMSTFLVRLQYLNIRYVSLWSQVYVYIVCKQSLCNACMYM
jgi:hypothetical protein